MAQSLEELRLELEHRLENHSGIVTQTTDASLLLLVNLPSEESPQLFYRFLESYIQDMRQQSGVHLFASIGKRQKIFSICLYPIRQHFRRYPFIFIQNWDL